MPVTVVVNGDPGDRFALVTALAFAAKRRTSLQILARPECTRDQLGKHLRYACWRVRLRGLEPPCIVVGHGLSYPDDDAIETDVSRPEQEPTMISDFRPSSLH